MEHGQIHPLRLASMRYREHLDSYENRVAAQLVDRLREHLSRRIRELTTLADCLARSSSSWPTVAVAQHVAVHLLAENQQDSARTFATSGIDRFAASPNGGTAHTECRCCASRSPGPCAG
ncbi:flavin reductase family protein [Verrucosispora sp. TAA-831]|uniref:flavin reductase family protein n=1 Tax=Verrucosispora sp. TAA-831 TaxID=3422227 RepID=UPI003D6E5A31